ncbi:hypothetical protein SAMD00019534_006580 [Acytostelium subglobosum LB1]|uniref:hypothetical protein n=1 Tax=Acytostelium subglobosum LB1 TaxID=1410327 RepID=UPI000644DA66|nr:hypothetical protein SAMD00019534_006580 [Acytostelium subglobosum LB1]GAM17483.1 hypothetical protein SAMD00019534_006580 [Acytostelium subglobosum LB1]|eukprot:XP_012759545.1 hypothetical protein SAMD00019534_006580 [Acytostelium subglobosum LB1]
MISLKDKVEKLGRLHSRNIATFDGDGDDEREIEVLTKDISSIITKTHHLIKNLGAKENLSPEEVKIKKNIQSAKSTQLQALSLDFKKKQRTYLSALQKNSSSFGWENGENEEEEEEVANYGFTMQQLEVVNEMDKQVMQRDGEIKQILRSINELSNIVQDISMMVIQQGTLLDQIEYNLEQTEESVVQGNVELGKANEYQKGYRSRLCILMILIVLIVTMVFVAIIKAFI